MTTICLRLFVTGHTTSAERARAAVTALERHLINERGPGAMVHEVVDVLDDPEIAARDGVFATPTLLRLSPGPSLRLFGDLSSTSALRARLGLDSRDAATPLLPAPCGDRTVLIPQSGTLPPVAQRAVTGEDARKWQPSANPGTSSSLAAPQD